MEPGGDNRPGVHILGRFPGSTHVWILTQVLDWTPSQPPGWFPGQILAGLLAGLVVGIILRPLRAFLAILMVVD